MKLLDCLSEKEKKLGLLKKYSKGTIVFPEDEECKYVVIVIRGTVQIVSYSLSGQEIVYNEIKENGLFGNNLLFSEKPYYKGNVIAKTDCEILLYNKVNLLNILQNNECFLSNYLSIQADFAKKLNGTIKLLSIASAEERFLYYLKENSPLKYVSVTSLSTSLFLTRETTSRLISKLEKEGIILHNGKIISLKK